MRLREQGELSVDRSLCRRRCRASRPRQQSRQRLPPSGFPAEAATPVADAPGSAGCGVPPSGGLEPEDRLKAELRPLLDAPGAAFAGRGGRHGARCAWRRRSSTRSWPAAASCWWHGGACRRGSRTWRCATSSPAGRRSGGPWRSRWRRSFAPDPMGERKTRGSFSPQSPFPIPHASDARLPRRAAETLDRVGDAAAPAGEGPGRLVRRPGRGRPDAQGGGRRRSTRRCAACACCRSPRPARGWTAWSATWPRPAARRWTWSSKAARWSWTAPCWRGSRTRCATWSATRWITASSRRRSGGRRASRPRCG